MGFFDRKTKDPIVAASDKLVDACQVEVERLNELHSKLIRQTFNDWIDAELKVKQQERKEALARDKKSAGYVAGYHNDILKKGYQEDIDNILKVKKALKNNKSTKIDAELVNELSALCYPLAQARISSLQYADKKKFIEVCTSTFMLKLDKVTDINLLRKKIDTVVNIAGVVDTHRNRESMIHSLQTLLASSDVKNTLQSRRNKSNSSFWKAIDTVLNSIKRKASTVGVKSASFAKHLDQVLFKANKQSLAKAAKDSAQANKSKSRSPRA